MVSVVVIIAVMAALAAVSLVLWRFEMRYAAEIQTVASPNGQRYDILVHRDGVMLYTKRQALWNANSVLPTAIALIHRWRRGPWRWAVTVRQSRFHGYPNLLSEVVDDDSAARRRASEIARRLEAGERLWPRDWES